MLVRCSDKSTISWVIAFCRGYVASVTGKRFISGTEMLANKRRHFTLVSGSHIKSTSFIPLILLCWCLFLKRVTIIFSGMLINPTCSFLMNSIGWFDWMESLVRHLECWVCLMGWSLIDCWKSSLTGFVMFSHQRCNFSHNT